MHDTKPKTPEFMIVTPLYVLDTDIARLFTEREMQVEELYAVGKTIEEIATVLATARKTVRSHLHNMCGKIGTKDALQLRCVLARLMLRVKVLSEKGAAMRATLHRTPCCTNEARDINGGCVNCGDPCL
jgi:DNA-binding CsgD family transcriptional regulator